MSLPGPVTKFWSARDDAFIASIEGDYADDFQLTFVGPHTPPFLQAPFAMTKEMVPKAMGNLMASFPDLAFTPVGDGIKEISPGVYQSLTEVTGKHTGEPFSPMPWLEKIPATNKDVKIGPETFTLTMVDGKVKSVTIEALHAGAPVGPPGFYTEIGGVMKPPPAA
mmetsp:Transcript_19810/g.64404  ORF Transcript_19810/g.64404 Transcript_19810/m.64404 type:complete len:166 (-) Transcript_19810:93-590(-)|eukprot:CAMPEP_0170143182 /NCGR_PEP_ID=MMETSP0033_2-20121228/9475_1 /TAXON_ID=195969 /ORGANISM="Dolichomastix tenuilepis, Strain CCMP3274" /LENGTH=165 /DNA_ID=CAMNT_0010379611 /DNA_START=18 /DNA_END=515 /DNA_ORIENTATION=+